MNKKLSGSESTAFLFIRLPEKIVHRQAMIIRQQLYQKNQLFVSSVLLDIAII